jgi:hypothetical protein
MLLIDIMVYNKIGILCVDLPVIKINWKERAVINVKPFVLYTICNSLHLCNYSALRKYILYEKYPLIN